MFRKMIVFLILILLKVHLQKTVVAQSNDGLVFSKFQKCGKLNADYLYNKKTVTELDEFPWIARMGFKNKSNKDITDYKCLGVLISRRYVLSVAHCFIRDEPFAVLLGDWDISNNPSERDCDRSCAPLPVQYEIEEIALHPDYKSIEIGTNDIALIRLTTDIVLSDHIQPICLPPVEGYAMHLETQYFTAVGFDYLWLRSRGIEGRPERKKNLVQVLDKEQCVKPIVRKPKTDNVICTTCVSNLSLMSGSTLMGVLIENSKPSQFYLLGLMSAGGVASAEVCEPDSREFFTEVSSHMKWIMYNIE